MAKSVESELEKRTMWEVMNNDRPRRSQSVSVSNRNGNFDLLPKPKLLLWKIPNILPKTKLLLKTKASV